MLVRMVTRSVSEVSSCDESLAYTSGYQKHGPTPKGGAVQLIAAEMKPQTVAMTKGNLVSFFSGTHADALAVTERQYLPLSALPSARLSPHEMRSPRTDGPDACTAGLFIDCHFSCGPALAGSAVFAAGRYSPPRFRYADEKIRGRRFARRYTIRTTLVDGIHR
ncbi:hypothetical protein Fuma_03618 [Fuerstiella marisgermanici]|uniref:Uncharacterized protein n=1 Tax=Fuerstiella marisgermanici TaxID=1891926 RepID=A0A1P8WIW1_9PLAN|nr:hypothetical protein Fuma_03618 [Fuerstiella marisgermanici]